MLQVFHWLISWNSILHHNQEYYNYLDSFRTVEQYGVTGETTTDRLQSVVKDFDILSICILLTFLPSLVVSVPVVRR